MTCVVLLVPHPQTFVENSIICYTFNEENKKYANSADLIFLFINIHCYTVSPLLFTYYNNNKATAIAVISRFRISNNRELKEIYGLCSKIAPLNIEEGVKGKSQQMEASLRPCLPISCFHIWTP